MPDEHGQGLYEAVVTDSHEYDLIGEESTLDR